MKMVLPLRKWQLLFTILIICAIIGIESEKILFVAPIATLSESNWYGSIVRELHSRGHHVTFVTSSPHAVTDTNKTLKQIVAGSPIQLHNLYPTAKDDLLEQRNMLKNKWVMIFTYSDEFITDDCHETYQNPQFMHDVLNKSKADFDLLIFPGFFHHCFYGLAHKFQKPFVIISSIPVFPSVAAATGSWSTPSFVPFVCLDFEDNMDFSDRFINAAMYFLFGIVDRYVKLPKYTDVYRKYLGSHYPSASDIEKNVNLVLTNSHFILNYPRPSIYPSIIDIGGFNTRPAKQLPKDIENFLNNADNGFIYFSLGTFASTTHMQKNITGIFINVFSRLKQRVLWKVNNVENFSNLTENIKVSKWFPQQDVLGHPKIKCFITQGGMFSTQESIYHGVPVLGIPIAADQDSNINQLVNRGSAIFLEILDLTEEAFEKNLRAILENSSYSIQAKKFSALFRDQPQSPVSLGMYWIDYIIKHKGAKHTFSAARELNFFQYFSLDIIAVTFTFIFVLSTISLVIFRSIVKKIFSFKSVAKVSKRKKQM